MILVSKKVVRFMEVFKKNKNTSDLLFKFNALFMM